MPEAHAHASSLTLDASSARIAMRAGSPPPGGYAQFAYSAVERAATAAAAIDAPSLVSAPPLPSRPQFVRSRRDRSPRPALDLRSGTVSLPRHAMRYDRLHHPPSRLTPYQSHGHVWTSLRRGQVQTQQVHPAQAQAPQFPAAVLVHQQLSHQSLHVTIPVSAPSQPPPPPAPHVPLSHREYTGVRVRGAHGHPNVRAIQPPHPLSIPHQPGHFSRHQHQPVHYARDIFAPGPHVRMYASIHDGRDPHRQKVKYVNSSFANQSTFLAVCPAGVATVSVPQRVHRPGEVVTGSVLFHYAPGLRRGDVSIVATPDVRVCCEVARRQVNPTFCRGAPAPPEDISDVPVPHGRQPFVYHHYVNQRGQENWRPVGLAHAPFNHCSDLIRGDNGAPLRVPTVTTARRLDDERDVFDFEFVLPDDLPHSYSWPDSSLGHGSFLDIRYRLMVSFEIQPLSPTSHSAPSAEHSSGLQQQSYLYTPSASVAYLPTSSPFVVNAVTPSSADSNPPSNRATTGNSSTSVGSVSSSTVANVGADSARYMVVCESYLLVASSVMPNPIVYLSGSDLRLGTEARKIASRFLDSAQQEIRVEVLETATWLDRSMSVRVTVFADRHLSTVTCRCGIEESVFYGTSPTKRGSSVSSLMEMRQSVSNGQAVFMFTLAPQADQLYPTSIVGPLAVRHAVVAYVSEYSVERPFTAAGSNTFCARGRPALHVELPIALRPSVTPLDPNRYASSLAVPVLLSQPPPMPQGRTGQSAFDGLVLRRDLPHGVCLRRRSAPAAPRPGPKLLEFGVRDKDTEDDTCPICMTEVDPGTDIGTLSCSHYGHRECMENMVEFSQKNRKDVLCPICRRRATPVD